MRRSLGTVYSENKDQRQRDSCDGEARSRKTERESRRTFTQRMTRMNVKQTNGHLRFHRNVEMRNCLMDITQDLRQIRLPFSVNQVGVYYEVLLAGTETIRQQRDLLRALDEHCKTPFGGPIRDVAAWTQLEEYINARSTVGHGQEDDALPPHELLHGDMRLLTRCVTPPPASSLFVGFLENDDGGRCKRFNPLNATDVFSVLKGSSSDSVSGESHDDTQSSDHSESGESKEDGPVSTETDNCEEAMLDALVRRKPLTTVQSLFDRPLKVEHGQVTISQFRHCHGAVQPDRFTNDMTQFAVKVHREIQVALHLNEVRERIRHRCTCHTTHARSRWNARQLCQESSSSTLASFTQPGFKVLDNTVALPLTSHAEEQCVDCA